MLIEYTIIERRIDSLWIDCAAGKLRSTSVMELWDHKQNHPTSSTMSVTLSDGNADANTAEDPEGGGQESDLERRPGAGALPFSSLRHLLGHLRDDEEHAASHKSGRAAAGAQIWRNSAIVQAAVGGM